MSGDTLVLVVEERVRRAEDEHQARREPDDQHDGERLEIDPRMEAGHSYWGPREARGRA